jgi:hypothetical protein
VNIISTPQNHVGLFLLALAILFFGGRGQQQRGILLPLE